MKVFNKIPLKGSTLKDMQVIRTPHHSNHLFVIQINNNIWLYRIQYLLNKIHFKHNNSRWRCTSYKNVQSYLILASLQLLVVKRRLILHFNHFPRFLEFKDFLLPSWKPLWNLYRIFRQSFRMKILNFYKFRKFHGGILMNL